MTLERVFIEPRLQKIETARTEGRGRAWACSTAPVHRDMRDDDVKRLLEIRIRRISAYDIEKHKSELEQVLGELADVRKKLKHLTRTVIAWLESLIASYGEKYKRRTKVTSIDEIDKKAVASANIRVSYDEESGFFGSDVRGSEFGSNVSEYDRILAVSSDGTYRIMHAPKKVLLPRKVLYVGVFDPEKGKDFARSRRRKQRVRQRHIRLHPRQGYRFSGREGQARSVA
jgi:topoisomerase-4 subunit A